MIIFTQYRLSMIFLLVFLYLFMPHKYSNKATVIILGFSYLITTILEYLEFYVSEGLFDILIVFGEIGVVQLTALIICQYKDFRALFTGITSSTYVLMGNIIYTATYIYTGNELLSQCIGIFIHTGILVLLVVYIRPGYLGEQRELKGYWGTLCIVPVLFYSIEFMLTSWPSNIYTTPTNAFPAFVTLLLMIVTYYLMIVLFYDNKSKMLYAHNYEILQTYVSALKHEIEATDLKKEEMAIYRHDVKHTNLLIESLLAQGEVEAAIKVLHQQLNDIDALKTIDICQNTAINGILSSKINEAKIKQIKFNYQVDVPRVLPNSNELELAIVISNLIDNAIEAASKLLVEQRWINLKIYSVKKQLMIEIQNPFIGEIKQTNESGIYISLNGEGHGYGTKSIQAFIEKYDAIYENTINNQIFSVKILLQI